MFTRIQTSFDKEASRTVFTLIWKGDHGKQELFDEVCRLAERSGGHLVNERLARITHLPEGFQFDRMGDAEKLKAFIDDRAGSRVPKMNIGQELQRIMAAASEVLRPILKRLIDPNVVESSRGLALHFTNGALTHFREYGEFPPYVMSLPENTANDEGVRKALVECLTVIRSVIGPRLGKNMTGLLTVVVNVSHGTPAVTSREEWVHKM